MLTDLHLVRERRRQRIDFNQLYSHAHCQVQHISDTVVVDILFRFIFCLFGGFCCSDISTQQWIYQEDNSIEFIRTRAIV